MRCFLALVNLVCEFDPLQRHPKLQCGPEFLSHLGGGGGDGVAKGGASISNLGRIQMLSCEQSSGANVMNFAVCRVTTPYTLVCCGRDEATMTQHLMGKIAVDGDIGRAGMVGARSWGACCATVHATARACCARLNACWIVLAAALVFSRRWKN
jgi:hypothetical protein